MSSEVIEDWSKRLPSICNGFSGEDIFNADETGLFFPSRSMISKNESSHGIKVSKERITILLCCSQTGEKIRPLIIGHSANPRCFRGLNPAQLGVDYYFNKKAWMTAVIFIDWLRKLNNKFRAQNRKILLFIDNCSSHQVIDLTNITLVLLPPNTTSKLQPCDAGIIQVVKLHYRKIFLRKLLHKIDVDQTCCAQDLVKSVNIMDAITWIRVS